MLAKPYLLQPVFRTRKKLCWFTSLAKFSVREVASTYVVCLQFRATFREFDNCSLKIDAEINLPRSDTLTQSKNPL